jgi:hypothetical protein
MPVPMANRAVRCGGANLTGDYKDGDLFFIFLQI